LAKELNNDGHRSKQFTAKTGKDIGGARFTKASLRRILANPIYVGKIRHKEKEFAGLHDAIIDQDLWDRAQATFKTAPKRNSAFCKSPVLLKGIIYCQACNIPMTPTYTAKKTGNTAITPAVTCCEVSSVTALIPILPLVKWSIL
jgi:site-specific DNA recombinase